MNGNTIAVAGAGGDLGKRILKALVGRGAAVRALVRSDASESEASRLTALGASVVRARANDIQSTRAALEGAVCVVSAVNGLRDVIVDRQAVLLTAAEQAGVPRFIPSDYAGDFTKTVPGKNRNLDLRREFMTRAIEAKIAITSILNGAFMDMLGAGMPIIQPRIHRVLCWESEDQLLDFTTKDDVAAYVAAVAMDAQTPRILRIAGDTKSARDIARIMSEVTGDPYRALRVGGASSLGLVIGLTKLALPERGAVFPPWQGMQYLREMFNGRAKLEPIDNDRYPELSWTDLRKQLGRRFGEGRV